MASLNLQNEIIDIEAVIINSINPDDNLSGEDLVLDNDGILLIKPGFEEETMHISELIIRLSLGEAHEGGTLYVGKIKEPWDISTATYNNRPAIAEIREINFSSGSTLEIDATQEANGYGIALWGNSLTVAMITQILSITPSVFNLPPLVAAYKKVVVSWKSFKTDYFVRRVIVTRNGIEVFNSKNTTQMQYIDDKMDYSKSYVYKLYAILS